MCGQFGQANLDRILNEGSNKDISQSKKQQLSSPQWPSIVKPNQRAIIYTHNGEYNAVFGFVKGQRKDNHQIFWFNARTEYYNNKENKVDYTGPYLLKENPHLKTLLSQRAIIPSSFFIESSEDNKTKRFLIKKKNQEALFLGGIWTQTINTETGEISDIHFCILTTPQNKATKSVNHKRCPVLIEPADIDHFLNPNTSWNQIEKYFIPNNNSSFESFEINPIQLMDSSLFKPENVEDFTPIGEVNSID